MQTGKAPVKPYACWSRCLIGAVLLIGLVALAQVVGRITQAESMAPHTITSDGIKVSIVGNEVHIETSTPVLIYFKPLGEASEVKLQPEQPVGKIRLGWGGPIIIAPTP